MRVRIGSVARPQGVAGKIFATLFFSIFLAAGLGLSGVVVSSFFHSLGAWRWPESHCTIDASGVEEHPDAASADEAYVFRVRYHYTAAGGSYTSVRYRFGYSGSSDVAATQRLALRYPPGAEVACYVDPDEPTEAMLERPSLWTGLIVLFPLIFVAVGAGGIAMTWWRGWRRGAARQTAEGDEPARRAISARASNPLASAGCLAGFFSIFLLAGLGFLIPFFLVPVWHVVEARSWTAVPCTILHSEVRTHSGEDSNTYSVEVLYSYRWPLQPERSGQAEGRELKSSRYNFMSGSTSGYQSKADVVASLSEGSETTCWVDPEDPTNAVLDRGLSGEMWFGLLPLVFVAVGAGGIFFALAGGRRKRAAAAAGAPAWLPTPEVEDGGRAAAEAAFAPGGATPAFAAAEGPVVLKPGMGPIGKFVGITFAALFWNGIVGVFVWKLVGEYQAGNSDGCLTLFLIPFVLIGLLLLASVPYQFLALFNPRPVVTLGTASPRLGETTSLEWRFDGSAGRLRRLRIALEGQEEATYTRGTTTSTDKRVFATLEVTDVQPPAVATGSAALTVPADTMHSFSADHNKIVWTLKVSGEIRGWPDVDQRFTLVVRPAAGGGGGR